MATDTLASPATAQLRQDQGLSRISLTASGSRPRPERLLKIAIPPTRATWSASSRNPPRPTWTPPSTPPSAPSPNGAWFPRPRRAEIVFRAAEILIERKEEYARDMTREMGKVLAETRGDVQEAIDAAYYNAGEGRRLFGPTVPSEMPNKFAMAVRQPIGVCGMITPWNFPMAISSWKLLPAIVCGNTCVIKPAQDTPLSTFNLVRAL